jgi:hypothetical protein
MPGHRTARVLRNPVIAANAAGPDSFPPALGLREVRYTETSGPLAVTDLTLEG